MKLVSTNRRTASRHAGDWTASKSGATTSTTSSRNSSAPSIMTTAAARSGRVAATCTATAPPRLWPTTMAPAMDRWSHTATTSPASVSTE